MVQIATLVLLTRQTHFLRVGTYFHSSIDKYSLKMKNTILKTSMAKTYRSSFKTQKVID